MTKAGHPGDESPPASPRVTGEIVKEVVPQGVFLRSWKHRPLAQHRLTDGGAGLKEDVLRVALLWRKKDVISMWLLVRQEVLYCMGLQMLSLVL